MITSRGHIQSPTRPARPVTRPATNEREEGEGGGRRGRGHDNDLVSRGHIQRHPRGQHDQSPAAQRVRGGEGRGKGRKRGGHERHSQPPAIHVASTTSHPRRSV